MLTIKWRGQEYQLISDLSDRSHVLLLFACYKHAIHTLSISAIYYPTTKRVDVTVLEDCFTNQQLRSLLRLSEEGSKI